MELLIFLIFMTLVTFAVAFVAYAAIVWLWGTNSSTGSKIAQMILVPVAVIGYDFVTIISPAKYQYMVGAIPILLIGFMLLYFKFIKDGSFREEAPEPLQVKRPSAKSLKHEAKKSARAERKNKKNTAKEPH